MKRRVLAEALVEAFTQTHPSEHVVFDDPDQPVKGQISGWFDMRVIAEYALRKPVNRVR